MRLYSKKTALAILCVFILVICGCSAPGAEFTNSPSEETPANIQPTVEATEAAVAAATPSPTARPVLTPPPLETPRPITWAYKEPSTPPEGIDLTKWTWSEEFGRYENNDNPGGIWYYLEPESAAEFGLVPEDWQWDASRGCYVDKSDEMHLYYPEILAEGMQPDYSKLWWNTETGGYMDYGYIKRADGTWGLPYVTGTDPAVFYDDFERRYSTPDDPIWAAIQQVETNRLNGIKTELGEDAIKRSDAIDVRELLEVTEAMKLLKYKDMLYVWKTFCTERVWKTYMAAALERLAGIRLFTELDLDFAMSGWKWEIDQLLGELKSGSADLSDEKYGYLALPYLYDEYKATGSASSAAAIDKIITKTADNDEFSHESSIDAWLDGNSEILETLREFISTDYVFIKAP